MGIQLFAPLLRLEIRAACRRLWIAVIQNVAYQMQGPAHLNVGLNLRLRESIANDDLQVRNARIAGGLVLSQARLRRNCRCREL